MYECRDGTESDRGEPSGEENEGMTGGSSLEGGRSESTKVLFNLHSSVTYLSERNADISFCSTNPFHRQQTHRSSLLTISHKTSCLVLSLGLRFETRSSSVISLQLCLTSQYLPDLSPIESTGAVLALVRC